MKTLDQLCKHATFTAAKWCFVSAPPLILICGRKLDGCCFRHSNADMQRSEKHETRIVFVQGQQQRTGGSERYSHAAHCVPGIHRPALRIAAHFDDLHAIKQCTIDRIGGICRRDKQYIREIKGGFNIVILEVGILFRIQSFQQPSTRVMMR